MSESVDKELPSFLPTLTEVVSLPPDVDVRMGRLPAAELAVAKAAGEGALSSQAMQQLPGLLAAQLSEMTNRLLQEQLRALAPRLCQEIELAVRQAVAQAVVNPKQNS
jgi:hypothetical protein